MCWTQSPDEKAAAVSGTRENSAGTEDWADMNDVNPEQLIVHDAGIEDPSSSSGYDTAEEVIPIKTPAQYLKEARENLLRRNPHLKPRFIYPEDLMPQCRWSMDPVAADLVPSSITINDDSSEDSASILDNAATATKGDTQRCWLFACERSRGGIPLALPSVPKPETDSDDLSEVSNGDVASFVPSEDETNRASSAADSTSGGEAARPSATLSPVYDRSKPHPLGYSWEWIQEWGDPLDPEPVMEFTPEQTAMARSVRNPYPEFIWIPNLRKWGPWDLLDDHYKQIIPKR